MCERLTMTWQHHIQGYRSREGHVMKREYGTRAPQGGIVNGNWVLRAPDGTIVQVDRYRNDIADRHDLSLEGNDGHD